MYHFSRWLHHHHLISLPAMHKGSNFSITSPTFGMFFVASVLFVSVMTVLMGSRCGLHSQETDAHFVMNCGPFAS